MNRGNNIGGDMKEIVLYHNKLIIMFITKLMIAIQHTYTIYSIISILDFNLCNQITVLR